MFRQLLVGFFVFALLALALANHAEASLMVLTDIPDSIASELRVKRGSGGGGGGGHYPGRGGGASGPVYICGYVGGGEGSGGGEFPRFSPSPEIFKNSIFHEDAHQGHRHSSSGCHGWKVIHHPMSKMYPFKYNY